MWRSGLNSNDYTVNISKTIKNDKLIVNEEKEQTIVAVNKSNNRVISKYGIVEDYRESKVLSSRRWDLRGHTLIMANVIADSNETKKHLDDRL